MKREYTAPITVKQEEVGGRASRLSVRVMGRRETLNTTRLDEEHLIFGKISHLNPVLTGLGGGATSACTDFGRL